MRKKILKTCVVPACKMYGMQEGRLVQKGKACVAKQKPRRCMLLILVKAFLWSRYLCNAYDVFFPYPLTWPCPFVVEKDLSIVDKSFAGPQGKIQKLGKAVIKPVSCMLRPDSVYCVRHYSFPSCAG